MPPTTLYLVRHAHAVWRPDEDRPLSDAGCAAADRVAALLQGRPIAAIYSSPSRRAIETIAPLAGLVGVVPELVPDLRERELDPVAADQFEPTVRETWRAPQAAIGRGESNAAAQARGLAVLARVAVDHPGRQAVLSTHGTLLALMLNGLDAAFGFAFWQRLTFPDVYRLDLDGTGPPRVSREWTELGAQTGGIMRLSALTCAAASTSSGSTAAWRRFSPTPCTRTGCMASDRGRHLLRTGRSESAPSAWAA
jgi:2,3-bisphosphoglycerate-dependent phosphoglycerate mutase